MWLSSTKSNRGLRFVALLSGTGSAEALFASEGCPGNGLRLIGKYSLCGLTLLDGKRSLRRPGTDFGKRLDRHTEVRGAVIVVHDAELDMNCHLKQDESALSSL
jgi:hypothetical protein